MNDREERLINVFMGELRKSLLKVGADAAYIDTESRFVRAAVEKAMR